MKIKLDQIIPDPDQPRKTFDQEKVVELSSSLDTLGLIQPITVRPHNGKYMIVVGERRFRAAQLDGQDEIECVVRADVDDKVVKEMQFAENSQQDAVPPLELGRAFYEHRMKYGMSQQELSIIVGLSQRQIGRLEALHTDLDPGSKMLVATGKLDGRTAYEISTIPDKEIQRRVADVVVERDLGRPTVERIIPLIKAAPQRPVESIVEQVRYNQETEKANHRELVNEFRRQSIPKPEPVAGKYRAITIDPPWPIEKILRDVRPNQFDIDYPTMTMNEITELPVPDLASEDGCHVYLWTTHKHLPDALELLDAWGARYQCLLTWVKNVGMTPFSFMYSTEHCLFGRIGDLPLLKMGERLDFQAKVREHSRKPDEFYALVRKVSPEPRLDMFGREGRDGFTVWGNEADKFSKAVA